MEGFIRNFGPGPYNWQFLNGDEWSPKRQLRAADLFPKPRVLRMIDDVVDPTPMHQNHPTPTNQPMRVPTQSSCTAAPVHCPTSTHVESHTPIFPQLRATQLYNCELTRGAQNVSLLRQVDTNDPTIVRIEGKIIRLKNQQIKTNQRLNTHDEVLRQKNNKIKHNAKLFKHGWENPDEGIKAFKFTFGLVMVGN